MNNDPNDKRQNILKWGAGLITAFIPIVMALIDKGNMIVAGGFSVGILVLIILLFYFQQQQEKKKVNRIKEAIPEKYKQHKKLINYVTDLNIKDSFSISYIESGLKKKKINLTNHYFFFTLQDFIINNFLMINFEKIKQTLDNYQQKVHIDFGISEDELEVRFYIIYSFLALKFILFWQDLLWFIKENKGMIYNNEKNMSSAGIMSSLNNSVTHYNLVFEKIHPKLAIKFANKFSAGHGKYPERMLKELNHLYSMYNDDLSILEKVLMSLDRDFNDTIDDIPRLLTINGDFSKYIGQVIEDGSCESFKTSYAILKQVANEIMDDLNNLNNEDFIDKFIVHKENLRETKYNIEHRLKGY